MQLSSISVQVVHPGLPSHVLPHHKPPGSGCPSCWPLAGSLAAMQNVAVEIVIILQCLPSVFVVLSRSLICSHGYLCTKSQWRSVYSSVGPVWEPTSESWSIGHPTEMESPICPCCERWGRGYKWDVSIMRVTECLQPV